MVHDGRRFHAFFQHHPHGLEWGPMHWGHATSTDLVAWDHQPRPALAPGPLGQAFSGSAVVDDLDTAGFGAGAVVLVFTHATAERQVQSLAWSTDGTTFTEADDNPVLVAEDGLADFRDPKVLRWGGADGHWAMVLAAGDEIRVLTSPDLHRWTQTDTYRPDPPHAGALETPDLFPLAADDGTERWVLALGVLQGAPAGGSGTWAVVGTFDGERFHATQPGGWVDHGADFYAAQSWSGVPDGRRTWTAWLSNWDHATALPARDWRGQLALPRELRLVGTGPEVRLVQRPVAELAGWHEPGWSADRLDLGPGEVASVPVSGPALDVDVGGVATDGVDLRFRRRGGSVRVEVAPGGAEVRVTCARDDVDAAPVRAAPTGAGPDDHLRVVLDLASVEVFLGSATITELLPLLDEPWFVTVAGSASVGPVAVGPVSVHPLAQGNWRHTT
ncbi:MAG: glycoside hydrolase family 32 protein [Acidimicrobiales bacterium]